MHQERQAQRVTGRQEVGFRMDMRGDVVRLLGLEKRQKLFDRVREGGGALGGRFGGRGRKWCGGGRRGRGGGGRRCGFSPSSCGPGGLVGAGSDELVGDVAGLERVRDGGERACVHAQGADGGQEGIGALDRAPYYRARQHCEGRGLRRVGGQQLQAEVGRLLRKLCCIAGRGSGWPRCFSTAPSQARAQSPQPLPGDCLASFALGITAG